MKPEDITDKTDLLKMIFSSINNLHLKNEDRPLIRDLENILDTALIHPSYANEHSINYDNQRLEFLGDAILSAVMAHKLLYMFPKKQEGDLTKLRSSLVDAKMCYKIAKKINLDKYIKVGNGLKNSIPNSILADGLEAVIGAAYLIYEQIALNSAIYESDIDQATCIRNLITILWTNEMPCTEYECNQMFNNYKGKLQEYCQKNKLILKYLDTGSNLPANQFQITAVVCSLPAGHEAGCSITNCIHTACAYGSNKQDAEMNAAKSILEQIEGEKK